MREEDFDADWARRVSDRLEEAIYLYQRSEFTEADLDELLSTGYADSPKQQGWILVEHAVAMCLHSPFTNEWMDTARRSAQIIGEYYNRRDLRRKKTSRIRKIRRQLEQIINARIDEPQEWQNISAQLLSKLQVCVKFMKDHENLFVNQNTPIWPPIRRSIMDFG